MKFTKLFTRVAVAGLLTGASGAAMAEGCGDGVLSGESFDNGLRVTDEFSCTIIGSSIGGKLEVLNVNHVLLINNRVDGDVLIDGNAKTGTANVIENSVSGGSLTVRDYEKANVIGNNTLDSKAGNIDVNSNIDAWVQQNISARNIICAENTTVDAAYNAARKQEKCE